MPSMYRSLARWPLKPSQEVKSYALQHTLASRPRRKYDHRDKNRVLRKLLTTPCANHTQISHCPQRTVPLHDTVDSLRDEVARDAEREQAGGNAPEPGQVAFVLLARHPDVHAPHTGDDVHGQDDGTEDGELAEDIGGLFGALVHADVDLGEVVAVGAGEEAVSVVLVFCVLFFVAGRWSVLTSRSDSGCLSW